MCMVRQNCPEGFHFSFLKKGHCQRKHIRNRLGKNEKGNPCDTKKTVGRVSSHYHVVTGRMREQCRSVLPHSSENRSPAGLWWSTTAF